jgi:hypothetical protein
MAQRLQNFVFQRAVQITEDLRIFDEIIGSYLPFKLVSADKPVFSAVLLAGLNLARRGRHAQINIVKPIDKFIANCAFAHSAGAAYNYQSPLQNAFSELFDILYLLFDSLDAGFYLDHIKAYFCV